MPLLRPSTPGPAATVTALAFDPAQGPVRLYSAGQDKVVRVWQVEAGRLVPQSRLAWPIYRDVRGTIYALAVQRAAWGTALVLGGIGAKTPQVQFLRAEDPDTASVLLDQETRGNQAVYSLAFQPGGSLLAVGHDGAESPAKVLVWNLAEPPQAGKTYDQAYWSSTTELREVRYLAFDPRGERLAVVGRATEGPVLRLHVWDFARGGSPTKIDLPARARIVTGLAWRSPDVLVVGTLDGGLLQIEGGTVGALPAPAHVTALAAWGDDLVVGEYDPTTKRGQVVLLSPDGQARPWEDGQFGSVVTAVAAGPGHVAASGLAHVEWSPQAPVVQIRVWSREGLVGKFPAGDRRTPAAAPINNVRIAADEGLQYVSFGTGPTVRNMEPAPYQWRFCPRFRESIPLQPIPEGPQRSPAPRPLIFATDHLVDRATGEPRIGPFPPGAWGSVGYAYVEVPQHAAIAIGGVDGIKLWRLGGESGRTPDAAPLRRFYGHEGPVTSLDVSPDGRWLVSGSTDGTIGAWSLEGLGEGNELGLHVTEMAEGLSVDSVEPNGPAWEAGFEPGQVITGIQVGGVPLERGQWRAALEHPVPGRELHVEYRLGQVHGRLSTTVSRDALWMLFPLLGETGGWILWTPAGYFDVSDPGALAHLEWTVNLGGGEQADEGVRTYPALVFRDLYQDPARLDAVIDQLRAPPPPPFIIPPDLGVAIDVAGGTVELAASSLSTDSVDHVEIWLNSKRIAQARGPRVEARIDPSQVREGRNLVFGVAAVRRDDRLVYRRKDFPLAVSRPAGGARRFHYLGIGVTELRHGADLAKSMSIVPLQAARNDAQKLADALGEAVGRQRSYSAGSIRTLVDREPAKGRILAELDRLAEDVAPDDLVVILLSGHGLDRDGRGTEGFFFVTYDSSTDLAATALTGAELNDRLSRLSCPALVLLDTCRSGSVRSTRVVEDLAGLRLGPVMLTSCASDQEAYEDAALGHGIFTYSVLVKLGAAQSLLPDAAPPAGPLDLRGLCTYVMDHVPRLRAFLTGERDKQNPILLDSLSVPLDLSF